MTIKIHEDGEGGAAPSGVSTTSAVGNVPGTETGYGITPPKNKKLVRRKVSMKEFMEMQVVDESVPDKEHPIVKEYDALKKHDIKTLRGMISGQQRIIDTSEFTSKDHAISHYLRIKHGNKKVAAAFGLSECEIDEAIKGWKNAHSDIMQARSAASAAGNSVALHQLRADGKESGMNDARKTFRSEEEAHAHVENIKKLNPGRKFRYNKYVAGQHVGIVESGSAEMEELCDLTDNDSTISEAFVAAPGSPKTGSIEDAIAHHKVQHNKLMASYRAQVKAGNQPGAHKQKAAYLTKQKQMGNYSAHLRESEGSKMIDVHEFIKLNSFSDYMHVKSDGAIDESDLHRAVSSGMKDLLVSGDHVAFKKVAVHLGHAEWQTHPGESDLAGVATHKLQQAHAHMYKGHALGESVEHLDEVEVAGADRYAFSHGKKPAGTGTWFFSKHKSVDFGKHKEGIDHISVRGTYGEAKKKATTWAKEQGHAVIHVQP